MSHSLKNKALMDSHPLTGNTPFLIMDTSTSLIQIGLWRRGKWIHFFTSEKPALESIFQLTQKILKEIGKGSLTASSIGGFVFCDGPGSVLSIRIAMMAILTWKTFPLFRNASFYTYNALEFSARCICIKNPFKIIAEAQRNSVFSLFVSNFSSHPIQKTPLETLEDESEIPIFHLAFRKNRPPERSKLFDYDLEPHASAFLDTNLMKPFAGFDSSYCSDAYFKTWTPQCHRLIP